MLNQLCNRLLFLIIGLGILILLTRCSEAPTLSLTSAQQDRIDTLFLQQVDSLRPILDSSCQELRQAQLQTLVDSIVGARQEEEAYLRQKYIPAFQ